MEPAESPDAVVRIDVRRRPGAREVRVEAVDLGTSTLVAAWTSDASSGGVQVVAGRSPDRRAVLVAIDGRRWCVALPEARATPIGPGPIPGLDAVVDWSAGAPRIVEPDGPGTRRLGLADGRTLVVEANVVADDGFSGGDQSSMLGVSATRGTPRGSVEAERARLVAAQDDAALVHRRAAAWLEAAHPPAVLLDGWTNRLEGEPAIHLPVSVGTSGVLVRGSTTRYEGDGRSETTIDRPWLVTAAGVVRRPEVRLGNAPLCELPDGRWLLPGSDPLWCDAPDEPLRAMAEDGSISPWRADAEVSTATLLGQTAPDVLLRPADAHPDAAPWATAGRVRGDGRHVDLLLAGVPWSPIADAEVDVPWAVVRVRADGRGRPSLVCRGRRTASHHTTVLL